MMITIDVMVESPIENVWENWINPEIVKKWNHASDNWYCPKAENDFKLGGKFSYIMAAKDNSASFDFWGNYTKIENLKIIESTLGDGRTMSVEFEKVDDKNTIVTESFETEATNSMDKQREGWMAILENFKKECEK